MLDFGAIRARIHDDADLVLYDEAVTCHQGGAYRAAYVFAWIAAAEGLLNKLDAMGAAQANIAKFVATFRTEQATGDAKDATLLDQAHKFGFVDLTEFKQLNALRDLRNQYGHPTAAAPSAASAAATIELVADPRTQRRSQVSPHRKRSLGLDDVLHAGDIASGWTPMLTREEQRSLCLHRAVADKVATHPERAIAVARRNLTNLRAQHPVGAVVTDFDEWESVLTGPRERLLDTLVSTSPRAIELRQNSPFAGVLTEQERAAVLDAFRRDRHVAGRAGASERPDRSGQAVARERDIAAGREQPIHERVQPLRDRRVDVGVTAGVADVDRDIAHDHQTATAVDHLRSPLPPRTAGVA